MVECSLIEYADIMSWAAISSIAATYCSTVKPRPP